MLEPIEDLEIKAYLLFILDFDDNTILPCFFYFFLIIDLYFLITVIIAQIFNPVVELVIPIRIPVKEAKAEIDMHIQ